MTIFENIIGKAKNFKNLAFVEVFLLTKSDKIGKNLGNRIYWIPKYFIALLLSSAPYTALAGSIHGGLFPLITVMPGKNTGWNLEIVLPVNNMVAWDATWAYSTATSWDFNISRFLSRCLKARYE